MFLTNTVTTSAEDHVTQDQRKVQMYFLSVITYITGVA